jgi:hypothetical protein
MHTPSALLRHIQPIKTKFHSCLLESLAHHLKTEGVLHRTPTLARTDAQIAALVVLCSARYGSIYFFSRLEARSIASRLSDLNDLITVFTAALERPSSCNQIINRAVFEFFSGPQAPTIVSPLPLPPWAFFTASPSQVFANAEDLYGHPAERIALHAEALFDLHDFAHLACASVSDTLYGAKYFRHFLTLPDHYRALIFHPDFSTSTPLGHADNLLFREFSLGLFNSLWEQGERSEDVLVDTMAVQMKEYLQGRKSLYHPSTGLKLRAPRPVSIEELAVLAQNKLYEHTASEAEELLFIRSGRQLNSDPLAELSPLQRFHAAADSGPYYYEMRNYLRHRAQRRAYVMIAEEAMQALPAPASTLAKSIFQQLNFFRGTRVSTMNLFEKLQHHLLNTNAIHLCN